MNILDIHFAAKMREVITDELNNAYRNLGKGPSAFIRDDAAATGMNYAKEVGKIAGLETALEAIERVEEDLKGNQ